MIVCPSCGETNPERARFCLACGTELAAPAPAAGGRKTVTIVFCDVTESTALGESLDPETLQAVMGRYFAAMRSALEEHGGTVEKFIGDAVVAVFGIPVLHEDDALRAVRAAVDMRSALAQLNRELRDEQDVSLTVRTGVNTGEVIVSGLTAGEPFASGDAVNVAARLEQSAAPGDVLIGEATYRLVRDSVEVELVAPLAVKGKAAPVTAYRLLAVSGEEARRPRISSPLVGRERELELLQQAFSRVTGDSSTQLVTLLGAPGVGKSRLVAEFLDRLGPAARVISGRCLSYGAGITFWPLREAVLEAAGIDQADDLPRSLAKLQVLLAGSDEAEAVSHGIAGLIGLDAGADGTRDGALTVRRLFESLAHERPLVAVFDDLHWAEPTFLDLVEQIARWSRDTPILLVCMARPDLLDVRRGWGGDLFNSSTALLEPLDEERTGQLVDNLAAGAQLTDTLRAKLVGAAEGNPLFVEELIETLMDDERVVGFTVPPTIQALLAARLDALPAEDRALLARAAVEGKVFHRSAVIALGDDADPAAADRSLANLVRKDLVRPAHSSLAGDEEFRFRHQLIRDAAYEALPKETRASLHERFTAWIESATRAESGELDELAGYHLEQASLLRAELRRIAPWEAETAAPAARHLSAAGYRAVGRNDVPAAITLLARASDLLPPSAERLAVQAELGRMLDEAGRLDEAIAAFEEVVRGDELNPVAAARARLGLALSTHERGAGGGLENTLVEVKRLAVELERLNDELGLARALLYTGVVTAWTGRISEAQSLLEHALSETHSPAARHERAMIASWLALCAWWGPTPVDDALVRCRELAAEAAADREAHGVARCATGVLTALQGEVESGRRVIKKARDDLFEIGSMLAWAGTSFAALTVELAADEPGRALELGAPVVAELQAVSEFGYLSTIAAQMADASYRVGRFEDAASFVALSSATTVTGDWIAAADCSRTRARLLARNGAMDEAVALIDEMLELTRTKDDPTALGAMLIASADVRRLAGRADEANGLLQEALRVFEGKGDRLSARRLLG
jgi:class 3 adenylate cyclase/tetratricopeptide (TPR) repeat protein